MNSNVQGIINDVKTKEKEIKHRIQKKISDEPDIKTILSKLGELIPMDQSE